MSYQSRFNPNVNIFSGFGVLSSQSNMSTVSNKPDSAKPVYDSVADELNMYHKRPIKFGDYCIVRNVVPNNYYDYELMKPKTKSKPKAKAQAKPRYNTNYARPTPITATSATKTFMTTPQKIQSEFDRAYEVELRVLAKLNLTPEIFGVLKHCPSRYYEFDLENEDFLIEIKSRPGTHVDKWPTTLVGANKFDFNDKRQKIYIFVFGDCVKLDSMWYYKDRDVESIEFVRDWVTLHDRSDVPSKMHVFIPRDKLRDLNVLIA